MITKVSFIDKCLNMNRAKKRRQRKLAQKSSKASENAKSTSSSFRQSTFNIQEALNTAVQFHVEGHHQEAKRIYREILDADPAHPIALQLLGVIAFQAGENEIAVELISKALAIYPEYVDLLTILQHLKEEMHLQMTIFHQPINRLKPTMYVCGII